MTVRIISIITILLVLNVIPSFVTNSFAQEYVAAVFTFGHGTGNINDGQTRYLAAFDGTSATSTMGDVYKIVIPRTGTLKNLYWYAAPTSTLNSAGNNITVLKNGAATALMVTWTSTPASPTTSGSNTTNSVSVNSGDIISVRIQLTAGSGRLSRPTVSIEFLMPGTLGSQWTTTATNNIFYNAGNVGIGTTNPGAQLHISRLVPPIQIGQPIPGLTQIAVSRLFENPIGGSTLETDFIVKDGSIGIGTTSPANKLHLHGKSGDFALTFTNNANTIGSRGYRIAFDNNRLTFQRATDSGIFAENQVAIDQVTGNVGIGITTPSSKLEVYQNGTNSQAGIFRNLNTGNILAALQGENVGDGVGVFGASGTGFGVAGETRGNDLADAAVRGVNTGYGDGVYGNGGTGVHGVGSYGVWGEATNDGLAGVYGESANGTGVLGKSHCNTTDCDGVRGVSQSYNSSGVVGENSSTGNGVFGICTKGTGVQGIGHTGVRGASSGNGLAVWGYNHDASGHAVYSDGNFAVAPGFTKSAIVHTKDYGNRKLYAVESPENWFEDFGIGQLVNGRAVVQIDPIFAQAVSLNENYHVFLTPRDGFANLYVTNFTPTSFEARDAYGKANLAFSYRIIAKRIGFEKIRLEPAEFISSNSSLEHSPIVRK